MAKRTLVLSKETVHKYYDALAAVGRGSDINELLVWLIENVAESDQLAPGEEGISFFIDDEKHEFLYNIITGPSIVRTA